jgi:hypothetical protein
MNGMIHHHDNNNRVTPPSTTGTNTCTNFYKRTSSVEHGKPQTVLFLVCWVHLKLLFLLPANATVRSWRVVFFLIVATVRDRAVSVRHFEEFHKAESRVARRILVPFGANQKLRLICSILHVSAMPFTTMSRQKSSRDWCEHVESTLK